MCICVYVHLTHCWWGVRALLPHHGEQSTPSRDRSEGYVHSTPQYLDVCTTPRTMTSHCHRNSMVLHAVGQSPGGPFKYSVRRYTSPLTQLYSTAQHSANCNEKGVGHLCAYACVCEYWMRHLGEFRRMLTPPQMISADVNNTCILCRCKGCCTANLAPQP